MVLEGSLGVGLGLNWKPLGVKGKGSGLIAEYGLIDDLEHRNIVAHILRVYGGIIQEPIPADIISQSKLLSFKEALREAHFPANRDLKGRKRLAFDEVFSYLFFGFYFASILC